MQRHFSIYDGAVFLGAALMILSVLGMFFDSNVLGDLQGLFGLQPYNEPQVMYLQVLPPESRQLARPTNTAVSPVLEQKKAARPEGKGKAQPTVPPSENLTYLGAVDSAPSDNPAATATPNQAPFLPERMVIPAIQLDAPVVPATSKIIEIDGQTYQQWEAPSNFAAGWQTSSAPLGVPGNTVLSGHHNIYGEVFGRLIDLQQNDIIQVFSGNSLFDYKVVDKMILPERGEPLSVRLDNARWMETTADERLTLVTCWPQWTNTHRLIIVAVPTDR